MRLTILLLALIPLLACSRPRPSPEYERAVAVWNELLRADADGAAEDPRADEVLERLGRVPPSSSDAPAALALRSRIEGERREHEAERSRRAEALRRAATPAPPVVQSATPTATAVNAPPPAPRAPQVTVGMKADAFRDGFGACFSRAGDATFAPIGGEARPSELWSLNDDERCRSAHPGLAGQVVVLADGVVAAIRPTTEVRRYEVRQEAQFGTLPDGRPGMLVDGKLVPIPPGAKVIRTDGGASSP